MKQFMQGLYDLVTSWQGLVYMLVIIMVFGIGVLFLIPSPKCRDFAKSHCGWVLVGCGLALGAVIIGTEINGAFNF